MIKTDQDGFGASRITASMLEPDDQITAKFMVV
jgi:hypothetical protein